MFLSLSLYMQYSCHLIIFITRLSPVPQSLSRAGGVQNWTQDFRYDLSSSEERGRISFLDLLATLPLQLRILLVTFTPWAHCWLIFNFLLGPSGPFFTAVFYLVSSQHILVHALLTTGLHPLPHHMSPHLSHYLVSPSSFCSCIDLPPPIHSQPPYSAHVSTVCIFSQISFFLFLNSWQFFLPPPPLDSDYSPASICHWFYLHSWLSPQEKQKLDPGCSYQKFAWMYLEERKRAAVWEKKGWCMIACIT